MDNVNFSNANLTFGIDSLFDSYLPSAHDPVSKIFCSPLKRKPVHNVQYHNNINTNVPATNFYKRIKMTPLQKLDDENKIRTVFKLTNINFSDEYTAELEPQLKEQAELVTEFMNSRNFTLEQRKFIRNHIITICYNANLNLEWKCAEIGVLYFYLASEKELPNTSEFVCYRNYEIEVEALRLRNEHKEHCPKHLRGLVPSGCNAYLMRAFVRMVFTTEGKFNPGGCIALKLMMYSRLKLLITEECRTQILKVVEKLLEKEKGTLKKLLTGPIEVHQDLEEIILIDMKLAKEDKVKSVYVLWDLLMVLFSPIGQIDEGNCFAVAPLANVLNGQNEGLVSELIKVLKSGKLEIDGIEIPAKTLLEGRRQREVDFNVNIPSNDSSQMTALTMLKERIPISDQRITFGHESANCSLNDAMSQQFGSNVEYAKQIYLSLKQNLLQQLTLTIFQFMALNSVDRTNENSYNSKKELIQEFNKWMLTHLSGKLKKDDRDEQFRIKIQALLYEHLFFIDYRNWSGGIENGTAKFEFHDKGLFFNGNSSDYTNFLKERRLFFFIQSQLIPVDSISLLGDCFCLIAKNVQGIDLNLADYDIFETLEFFVSNRFKELVSSFLAKSNARKSPLSAEIYNKSDSFFMAQNGSGLNYTKVWPPMISVFSPPIHIQRSSKPVNFFKKVCEQIRVYATFNPAFFQQPRPMVLIDTATHVFNLDPISFQDYWIGSTQTQIDTNITDRVKKLQKLSESQKMSILIQTIGQENIDSEFTEILYTDYDITHFSKEVKNIIIHEYHEKLDVAISRILNEISFDQVANNLANILALQGICDSFYYHVIINSTDWSRYQSMTSYKLTKVIHKALLKGSFPLYVSTDKLNKLIRNFFSLPEAIDLGNLNWTDFSEKKDYEYFGMEYDIHKNDFVFFQKKKGIRKPLDEGIAMGLLEGVKLRFPR